ncbi:MAG: endonuclease III [Verrucomicrobia bacterium]|nr:endonuclease III [Verrucomicrobiota bacterium]
MATKATSISKLIAALRKTYPDAHCELNFTTPLELLVATILSAQCTDKRVNMVTPALFARFRTAADYAVAPLKELERMIQSTGFFRNKAKAIQAACVEIVEKHAGCVPDTMEALTALHGVGCKTANVILGNAFGKSEGVVVDTHVIRLSQRIGLTKQKTPEKIEADLMKLVPRDQWTMLSHWLIWHGRRRCYARGPECEHCELAKLCPKIGVEK